MTAAFDHRNSPGAQLVPAPATSVSANAPSGQVSSAVNCCPNATVFDVPSDGASAYFGFDDKTNEAELGQSAYWVPATAKKNDPPLKPLTEIQQARDGAGWASVPVGETIMLRAGFLGSSACATNCTFEVQPASVARVVDPKPGPGVRSISIKGEAEGEAVLKVFCNGALLGYVYLWCRKIVTVELGMGTIFVSSAKYKDSFFGDPLTTRPISGLDIPSVEKMKQVLDATFRAALLRFNVTELGVVDFDAAAPAIRDRARHYVFDGPFPIVNNRGQIAMEAGLGIPGAYWQSAAIELAGMSRRQVGGGKPCNIWFLSPPELPIVNSRVDHVYGVATSIPTTDAYVFLLLSSLYQTAAHEIGHALGLRHPNDPDVSTQLPAHVLGGGGVRRNVAPGHETNLMGYKDNAFDLLYGQWRIAHENAAKIMQGAASAAPPAA